MILPWENHFGKRTVWSLIYFELQPIIIFSPVANFGDQSLLTIKWRILRRQLNIMHPVCIFCGFNVFFCPFPTARGKRIKWGTKTCAKSRFPYRPTCQPYVQDQGKNHRPVLWTPFDRYVHQVGGNMIIARLICTLRRVPCKIYPDFYRVPFEIFLG